MPNNGSMQTKGFFAALFDFGFTSFITLKFLKVIYGVLTVLVLLVGLVFLLAGLSKGGGTAVLSLVGAPVVTLLYLVFIRISMEVIALFFRIGENTSVMATALAGQTPPPAGPGYGSGGYGSGGPGGPGTPDFTSAPTVTPTH